MTLHIAHIDKEFLEGGFETLVKWIREDLITGEKTLEEMHKFYNMYTFGPKKKKLTEDQFFLAYKSAELVFQDAVSYAKRKKTNQMFRRQ